MSLKGLLQSCLLVVFLLGVSLPSLCYSSQCAAKKTKVSHACCHEAQLQKSQFKNSCCRSEIVSDSFVIPSHSELKEINQPVSIVEVTYSTEFFSKKSVKLTLSDWRFKQSPSSLLPVLRI